MYEKSRQDACATDADCLPPYEFFKKLPCSKNTSVFLFALKRIVVYHKAEALRIAVTN